MGRIKTRRLTAAQFAAAMVLITNMSPERRTAARLALVDGMTAEAVGTFYGWSRTAVNNAERVVWEAAERFRLAKAAEEGAGGKLPRGWGREVMTAPKPLLKQWKAQLADQE
ncbi:MAG: hypothetical protein V4723_07515 [Pseudomonadota bacterium]